MPVCIAGMPDSGMTLVSRLLDGLGLDLGPIRAELPPSADGRFAQLNDQILDVLDAAWNSPPRRKGDWACSSELEPLRRRAASQVAALGLSEPWGWADPRSSLTLPFWRELLPDLRLLICVRDPREVAGSLRKCGLSSAEEALSLWEEYYSAIIALDQETAVVTHYDSYRDDPKAELDRVARALGIDNSRVAIAWTAAGVELPGRSESTGGELPHRLQDLHDRLLVAAKKPLPGTSPPQSAQSYDRDDVAAPLAAQRRELEHLRLELAGARGHIDALRTQVEVRSLEPIELREIVLRLEQQLVERDEELEKLRKALREGDAWRREVEAAEESLTRTVEALREELDLIKSTRLWRTGQRYWALKSRLRQLGRPGSS